MNRSVLARQMFAQGGAAVPNEYKGFSKLPENVQMKMDPVAAEKYAEGGDVAMEQGLGSMVQAPPMPAQESVDPAIMKDMLMRAGEGIQDLENVDNYEQMMNMIRGDEASVPERRTELAGLVGEQDAAQTPESVLALVQPVVQIASVDEGIGGLAQETMTQPVQGAMAQGIMSTMAPPEPMPPAAPPMAPPMMGGPPPANFKDGGLVRRGDNQPVQKFDLGGGVTAADLAGMTGYQSLRLDPGIVAAAQQDVGTIPAREATNAERLRRLVEGQKNIYREYGLGDPEARAADLKEQKDLTQAQMLFDVAQTALTFAAPMEGERPGMSPAERLAMAARTTQLPQTIGARAQQQLEAKRAAEKEGRTLDLAALQSAETKLATEIASERAIDLAKAKEAAKVKTPEIMTLLDKTGTKVIGQFNINDSADYARATVAQKANPGSRLSSGGPEKPNTVKVQGQIIDITDLNNPKVIFGTKDIKTQTVNGQVIDYTDAENVKVIFGKPSVQTVTVKGQVIDITKPEAPKVIFGEKDPTIRIVEGQVVDLTDKNNPVVVFGDPKKDTAMVNGQLIDYTDIDNPRVIYGDKDTKTTTVNGEVIDITDINNPKVIFGKPDRKTLTVKGQVLDITDPDDVKVLFGDKDRDIRVVKGQLVEVKDGQTTAIFGERTPKTGTFENMILSNGNSVIVKKVGETLYDTKGDPIDLATEKYKGAILVSKDKAFSEAKTAKGQARASDELARLDRAEGDDILSGQVRGLDPVITERVTALGGELSPEADAITFDALNAARKGTGFYNILKQGISQAGGALVPGLRNAFADEVAAGQFIDTIGILGRVGLANSPRYAEGEQVRLAKLFPDTETLLANPENAVRSFVNLKKVMRFQYRENLNILAGSSDSVLRRQAEQSNYAIKSVLKMLETIPDRGVVADESVNATIEALRRANPNRSTGAN